MRFTVVVKKFSMTCISCIIVSSHRPTLFRLSACLQESLLRGETTSVSVQGQTTNNYVLQ